MELLDRQLPNRDRRMARDEDLQQRCCLLRPKLGQKANDPVLFEFVDQHHRSIANEMPLQSGGEQSDRPRPETAQQHAVTA